MIACSKSNNLGLCCRLTISLLLSTWLCGSGHAAGVTVITHGFGSDADGWVLGMAAKIPAYSKFPGTNILCYEMTATDDGGINVTGRRVGGGGAFSNSFSGEIVIKLDWGALAGIFNQYDTYEVAAAAVTKFVQTNFIPELGGHALAELPIHLIGHSRGASLVCELARLLGLNGLWIDHLTTLDPHPVNQDGNSDPLTVTDAPLRIYENVLFADNYYQDFGGYPSGQFIASSYNRRFISLPDGYASAHSDTHLWYHATIDLNNPANDSEALLSAAARGLWFNAYENDGAQAGFYYSLLGGGDRFSSDRPTGPGTDMVKHGFNQRWDLGAGTSNNRLPLPSNSGIWPNILRFNLLSTNVVSQGGAITTRFHAQWAQPAASSATVTLFLDNDFNPYNGNEQPLRAMTLSGTGKDQISMADAGIPIGPINSTPGWHSLLAKVTTGARTRYLYAPETLIVVPTVELPSLRIARAGASAQVTVTAPAGQRVAIEATADFSAWTPMTTNVMSDLPWTYSEPLNTYRFFRAIVK